MSGRPPQKRRRISRSAEFERAYRQGRSKGNRHLVLYAFPRAGAGARSKSAKASRTRTRAGDVAPGAIAPHSEAAPATVAGSAPVPNPAPAAAAPGSALGRDAAGPRLGVSVSRRVGGAVERSRVKRLLREAFWAEADRMPADVDYVIVARPECRLLGEREGMEGVRASLAELIDALAPKSEPAPARPSTPSPDADAGDKVDT